MIQRSASSLSRLALCGHSLTPGLTLIDETNESAEYGTEVHDDVKAGKRGKPEANVFLDWIERNAFQLGNHELGFAYDGKEAVLTAGREEYGATSDDGRFYGTADFVFVFPDGRAVVVDWKTGWQENLAEAKDNLQVQSYAFMAMLAVPGIKSVRVGWINAQPNGNVRESWYDMTDFDHAAVKATIDSIRVTAPNPGPQCTWCPARQSCPATTTALALLSTGTLDINRVGEVWHQIRAAEDLLKRIKDAAKEHVEKHGPMSLPNGRRLKLVNMPGRRTVGTDDLRAHLGDVEFAVLEEKGIVRQGEGYSYLKEGK